MAAPDPFDQLSRYASMLTWRAVVASVLDKPDELPAGAMPSQYRIELNRFLGVLDQNIRRFEQDELGEVAKRFLARMDGGISVGGYTKLR